MSGRPRTTSFAEGNKQPLNPPLGGMKISSKCSFSAELCRKMTLVRPKIRSNMADKSAFIFIYTIVIILFCWVELNCYLKHALIYNVL